MILRGFHGIYDVCCTFGLVIFGCFWVFGPGILCFFVWVKMG